MTNNKLRREDIRVFSIDLIMTIILVINLLWFAFDFLWMNRSIKLFFEQNAQGFYSFYQPIHENFGSYDIWFVLVFLAEFLIRWAIAVARGTYHKWFYYPIIHFYDVLGLIPASYFRILRVLRLVSIMYRLQRMGIINVQKWYVYQQLMFLKDIFLEEVTDRVIIRMLTGIQMGVDKDANPDADGYLVYKAVYPHKQEIINWISNKVRTTVSDGYIPKRDEIEQQIKELVRKVLSESGPIQTLEKIPVVGKSIAQKLEINISEGIFEGIDKLMHQLADDENTNVEEMASKVFDAFVNKDKGDDELNRIIKAIVVDMLEEIKRDTAVKEWQLKMKGEKI